MHNGEPTEITLALMSSRKGRKFLSRLWVIHNHVLRKHYKNMIEDFDPDLTLDINKHKHERNRNVQD